MHVTANWLASATDGTRGAIRTPLVRAGGAMMLSAALSSGIGSLYWVVAARLFPVTDVGLASASIAAMTLIGSVSVCGGTFVAQRFLPVAGSRSRELARRIQGAMLLLGATGGLVFTLAVSARGGVASHLGLLLVAGAALYALSATQDSVLLGLGKAGWVPIENAVFNVGKLAALAGAAWMVGASGWWTLVWPWFAALLAGTALSWALAEIRSSARTFERPSDLPPVRSMIRFGVVNYIGTVMLQLPGSIFPLLALAALGRESSAYFYVTWMIASLVMILAGNISNATVAQAVAHGADTRAVLNLGARLVLAVVLPGAACLALSVRILLLAFGASYQHGFYLLLVLALTCPVYALNAFYSAAMRVSQRLRPVVAQGFLSATVAIGLAWPLMHVAGLAGLGLAYMAGQGCALAPFAAGRLLVRFRHSRYEGPPETIETGAGGVTEESAAGRDPRAAAGAASSSAAPRLSGGV